VSSLMNCEKLQAQCAMILMRCQPFPWDHGHDSEMTDKDLERRKTRHATLSPYANIASSVNLKSGAFTYHPPYPLRRRRHE
jgi:hypothetical protein